MPFLSILEDPGQQLTVEQVISPDFLPKFTAHGDQLKNLGFRDSAWWARLDIQYSNPPQTDWYGQFTIPLLTVESDIYLLSASHPEPVVLSALQEKTGHQRLYTFKLPKMQQFSIILRINNHGKDVLHFPLQLLTSEQLYQQTAADHFLYGGIMLSVFVLAIYNLFFFISLRHYAYLTLAVYLLASIVLLQRTTNVIPFLSSMSDPTTFYYAFGYQLVLVSSVQFWRQLLNSRALFPDQDQIARFLLVPMIVITPFISVLPYPSLWPLVTTIIVLCIMTLLSLLVLNKHSESMISLSLAVVVIVISATPVTLCSLGFFYEKFPLALDIYNIGMLCSTVLISFTLADKTRQLRRQLEHAQIENKAREDFLTTMSHELRTPMHTATSVIHLLKANPLTALQQNYLAKLEASNSHMLELINNVLNLARSKSNALQLEHLPFRLSHLLTELDTLVSEAARKKHLRFRITNHCHSAEQWLGGDPMRLKQVLLNLLDNAIKFTETGGVTLTILPVAGDTGKTQTIKFMVRDTGIGITNAQQDRLFEAFYQADSSTTRKYGGSGLGLSISHHLIKRMGGELKLESTPDQGCQFFFTLTFPLQAPPPESRIIVTPPEKQADPGPLPADIRVLLVEDNSLNRLLGQELINAMGFICIAAESGKEAIHQLQQQPVDLVLMDISMPDMDGYQTTRKIREYPRFAGLPIIALTAHNTVETKERCLAAGMDAFLSKPFDPERLKETLLRSFAACTPR